MIDIRLNDQHLTLWRDREIIFECSISSAKNGVSNQSGSFGTPVGHHTVRAKIGVGLDRWAVLKGRRATGEILDPQAKEFAQRLKNNEDFILGRILWLSGVNVGFNRMGSVDTMRRFVYIHATPYIDQLGSAVSQGCIRVAPDAMVELFDLVELGERVYIASDGLPL